MHGHSMTRRKTFRVAGDERGGILVLVAIGMVSLCGFAALAIDLGMGYTAKIEAQRTADASALAGASAFLEFLAADAVDPAEARAYEFALQNEIRNIGVDSSEVTVQVVPDSFKVRVWVQRQTIGTWFARLIGIDQFDVLGVAAAQATEAGSARCLKPIALPDMWYDADDDEDGDRLWDEGEEWEFGSSPDDRYVQYQGPPPEGPADATGYGSEFRGPSQDWGRQITLKAPDPQSEYVPEPGIFLPWRLPIDEDQEACDRGGGGQGGQDSGGAVYRQNLCSCNDSQVDLGVEYQVEPGNMIGPTFQGISELIDEDPNAVWDPSLGENGGIANSAFGDGLSSPRVVKIALMDPGEIDAPGMQTITFNNFALLFIEDMPSNQDPIIGRFMYYVSGEGDPGPNAGSLVRYLRLVE